MGLMKIKLLMYTENIIKNSEKIYPKIELIFLSIFNKDKM